MEIEAMGKSSSRRLLEEVFGERDRYLDNDVFGERERCERDDVDFEDLELVEARFGLREWRWLDEVLLDLDLEECSSSDLLRCLRNNSVMNQMSIKNN